MQRNVERVPDLEGAGKFLNLSVARRQRCAIFNGVNFHLDVTAGLAWAFQVCVGWVHGALLTGHIQY